MKTVQRILSRLALIFWLPLCVGCDSQSTGSGATQTATPPSPSASSTAGSEPAQSKAETAAAPVQASNAAPAQQPSGNPASAPTAPMTLDTTRLPKPTEEQVARWRERPSQPLQLLASRDGSQLGFISFLEAFPDGQHYLIGGSRLTLCSVGSDKVEHTFIESMTAESERLTAFAVAPGGDWCVVGNASGILKVFSIADRKETASVKTGQHSISQLAIATDGKEIATVAFTKDIEIWDALSLKSYRRFSVDTREVKQLKYIGPQLLIAAGESMSSWNTVDGTRVTTYPAGRYQQVSGVSAGGKELLFGNDQGMQRWNLSANALAGVYPGSYARNEETRFAVNGSQFASFNGEAIRIWDTESGQLQQVIDAAGNAVTDASWVPGQSMLLVASDNGRVRIWGTEKAGKPFGMGPLHKAAEWPKIGPAGPANVDQLIHVLDLRLLPKLPHATPVETSFNALSYSATVGIDETRLFYRYLLGQQQWKETTDAATPDSLRFSKDGCTALLSTYLSSAAETFVSLAFLGNYDIRQTPRLKHLVQKEVYSGDSTVMYTARASLLQIETDLLRQLHRAGWTAVARLNSRQNEESDSRQMEFVKNGVVLNVFVRPENDQVGQFSIQYATSLTLHALPIPPDSGLVEWGNHLELQMVANTSMTLKQATEFYDAMMVKQGWLPQSAGRRVDEEKGLCYLPYMWGQRDVTIGLRRLPDGSVRIRAGKYSQESWQPAEDDGKLIAATGKEDQKPVPTTRVSFEAWLRENRHPSSLNRLDEYKEIMQKLPAKGN